MIKKMLICFSDMRGIIHLASVPQETTVNETFYVVVLKVPIDVMRCKQGEFWRDHSLFLHHNTLAHSSLWVSEYLAGKGISTTDHPPYSPDLAPAKFWLISAALKIIFFKNKLVSKLFAQLCTLSNLISFPTPQTNIHNVRFEAFMAVTMKDAIFWDAALSTSSVNRHFGGTHHLHLLCRKIHDQGTSVSRWLQSAWRRRREAIHSSKTSVHTRSTQHHTPEDGILNIHNFPETKL
jgi:hypothetical protein